MSDRIVPGALVEWQRTATATSGIGVALQPLQPSVGSAALWHVARYVPPPQSRHMDGLVVVLAAGELHAAGLGLAEYHLREWLQQRRGRIVVGPELGHVITVAVPRPITRSEVRDLSDPQAVCLLQVLRANARGCAVHLAHDDRAVRALLRRALDNLGMLRLVGGGWARSPAEPPALQLLERRARRFWAERERTLTERVQQLSGADRQSAIAVALGLRPDATAAQILKAICRLRGEGGVSI